MTGAEVQAVYFSPIMFFFYLSTILVIMGLIYQIAWDKKCNNEIKLIIAKVDGDTDTKYVKKEGNVISLTNPQTGVTKTWAISKYCALTTYYPGDGFIPKWLQKKIKTAILSEYDMEPLLNIGPYIDNVASPDVIAKLEQIIESLKKIDAEGTEELSKELDLYTGGLSTAPTREPAINPDYIGALIQNTAMKAVTNISDTLTDAINNVTRQLSRLKGLNPNYVYIGLGISIILIAFMLIKVVPAMESMVSMAAKLDAISKAMGVTVP